jgi:hypothetical protein
VGGIVRLPTKFAIYFDFLFLDAEFKNEIIKLNDSFCIEAKHDSAEKNKCMKSCNAVER